MKFTLLTENIQDIMTLQRSDIYVFIIHLIINLELKSLGPELWRRVSALPALA